MMLKHRWSTGATFILAGTLLVGCSQIRTTNRPEKSELSNMVIKAETFDTSVCSRGMFVLSAHKDLIKGEVVTNGRGYVTAKPMENPDPYYQLKLGLAPKNPEAKTPPDVSKKVGNRIEISLGEYSISPAPQMEGDYAMTLSAIKSEAGVQEDANAKRLILSWDPRFHAYYSAPESSPKSPVASTQPAKAAKDEATAENPSEEEVKKAQAVVRGGVGTVRSFVFGLKDADTAVAIAANLPNDITTPETEDGQVEGMVGQTFDIPVEGSEISGDAQGLVTVLIEEAAEKPTWRAFFHQRDDDGSPGTLAIPTVGVDINQQAYEMKPGPVRVVISRQIMTTHGLGDASGGDLCTVTGAGITTYGAIAPKKE